MLSTILLVTSSVLSCVAIGFSLFAVFITKKKSVRSISLRRLMVMQDKVDDQEAVLAGLVRQVRNVRSRLNMAKKRADDKVVVEAAPGDEPDPNTQPEAWRNWALQKHLRK